MKILSLLAYLLLAFFPTHAQSPVPWSAQHPLTAQDFQQKLKPGTTPQAAFQLTTETRTNLYTHQKRTLVRNQLLSAQSSLSPTQDVAQQLRLQQTLFNITEIYARRLRQHLQTDPPAPTSKTDPAAPYVAAAAKRRQRYRGETQNGTLAARQTQWEKTIRRELAGLQAFALPE